MYHPLVPMETGFTFVTVFLAKHTFLANSKLCLNPDIFTCLIEPEHLEKYISLPVKTEEMV